MNPRDALQSLALNTRGLLNSLCEPALAPFLADWPDPGAPPLLALYIWRGRQMNQKARLESAS